MTRPIIQHIVAIVVLVAASVTVAMLSSHARAPAAPAARPCAAVGPGVCLSGSVSTVPPVNTSAMPTLDAPAH